MIRDPVEPIAIARQECRLRSTSFCVREQPGPSRFPLRRLGVPEKQKHEQLRG